MNTKKYLQELLDGSGHLNPNVNKLHEKSPDYGGYIKIGKKIYRLSAWVKETKTGKKNVAIKAVEADLDGQVITYNNQI